MSWSVGVTSVPKDELDEKLSEAFDNNYPEPQEGVREQFELARNLMEGAVEGLSDGSSYNASLSGHAKQGDDDWGSSLFVSVTSNK